MIRRGAPHFRLRHAHLGPAGRPRRRRNRRVRRRRRRRLWSTRRRRNRCHRCRLGLGRLSRRRRFGNWRRRRRGSRRSGCRRRRGRRRRKGSSPRRKQRQWIDVRFLVADPDTEVDVRDLVLGNSGRPCFGQGRPFRDTVAAFHEKWPEMGQRDLVAVGVDRDGEPVRRHLAGECDLAGDGRIHLASAADSDVDTAMLSGRVGIVAEREIAEDVAVRRPGPGVAVRRKRQRQADRRQRRYEHPRCPKS